MTLESILVKAGQGKTLTKDEKDYLKKHGPSVKDDTSDVAVAEAEVDIEEVEKAIEKNGFYDVTGKPSEGIAILQKFQNSGKAGSSERSGLVNFDPSIDPDTNSRIADPIAGQIQKVGFLPQNIPGSTRKRYKLGAQVKWYNGSVSTVNLSSVAKDDGTVIPSKDVENVDSLFEADQPVLAHVYQIKRDGNVEATFCRLVIE